MNTETLQLITVGNFNPEGRLVISPKHWQTRPHQKNENKPLGKFDGIFYMYIIFFVRKTEIISPYDDKIPGNPIGTLQEMCMSRHWPPPCYEMVNEEGLPHERLFTIACVVFKHRETG